MAGRCRGRRPIHSCASANISMTLIGLKPSRPLFYRASGRRASLSQSRSEEHTSELQSLMRISYAVFCLKKKKNMKTQDYKRTQRNRAKPNKHNKKIYMNENYKIKS